MYRAINPADEQLIAEFPPIEAGEIEDCLELANNTYKYYKSEYSLERRLKASARVAELLEERKQELSLIITEEMGKPIDQSIAEVEKCAWLAKHYAEVSESVLSPENLDLPDGRAYMRYDPIGAVFGVMPWNFPYWQCFRYAIPCLMAGNVILLKPASNVPKSGLALQEIFTEAFGMEGLFQNLLIDTDDTERIIKSPVVQGVTLTGSEKAGSSIAGLAGKYLKKSVLELGGSDPFIVLADADLNRAAETFVASRMNNNGQTCIAAKRLIVAHSIRDEFTDHLKEAYKSLKVGEPKEKGIKISYVSKRDIAKDLEEQNSRFVKGGARTLIEGGRVVGTNRFLPVLLDQVDRKQPVWKEEVFGPLAVMVYFQEESQAVQLANDTPFGLGCSIWSRDLERAERLTVNIDAGSIHINKLVSSDPRVPFGGVKHSGYGRELGKDGLLEFCNRKSVTIQLNA